MYFHVLIYELIRHARQLGKTDEQPKVEQVLCRVRKQTYHNTYGYRHSIYLPKNEDHMHNQHLFLLEQNSEQYEKKKDLLKKNQCDVLDSKLSLINNDTETK